jgi:1-acyl-sn-glycerol-3-phosphate acyltransferase
LRVTRIAAYLALTLPLMPVQAILVWRNSPSARRLPVIYHGWICRLLGIRLDLRGVRSTHRPTRFVANHTSYLDIEIFGAAIEGSFVSKAEVSRWPIFGWLAKLQRTVFVERADRAGAARQRDEIRHRLDQGDNLILFPEGTSGDGTFILPFKSALFSVVFNRQQPVTVQPVSLAYTRLDGLPIGRTMRPFFAWYGDMDLTPHLWRLLGLGVIEAVVEFHPPVAVADFLSRKTLAAYCEQRVAGGVSRLLAGREAAAPAAAMPQTPQEPAADIAGELPAVAVG